MLTTPPNHAEWIRDAVGRYEAPLMRYAYRLLGDVELAREVVQDAFLRLWQADPATLDGRLAPWLYRVCRNRVTDVLRKEGRMTTLSDHELETAQRSDTAPDGEVLALLAALPDNQQEALRLKFQCGLTYREIGEVTELTVSHVGVLIHNGIKTIREKLGAADRLDPSVSR